MGKLIKKLLNKSHCQFGLNMRENPIYEFYNDQECLNLHRVIEKLVSNKKIDLLAAA